LNRWLITVCFHRERRIFHFEVELPSERRLIFRTFAPWTILFSIGAAARHTKKVNKGKSMNRLLLSLVTSGFVFAGGLNTAVAQDDDDSAAAVEIYTCSYADGMGAADLNEVIAKWNKWADDQGMADYSAWTLTPFYYSPEQDFDFIWLGVTATGKGMGDVQDIWLSKGGTLGDGFDSVAPCDSHSMSAAVQFKAPPKREDRSSTILDFSDCTVGDGKHFSTDVAPAL
jgi:hypothetical protein